MSRNCPDRNKNYSAQQPQAQTPKMYTPKDVHINIDCRTEEGTYGDVDCRLRFLKEEPVSMTVTPLISILNVLVAEIEKKSMQLPITLSCEKSGNKNVETKALLDTGAGEN